MIVRGQESRQDTISASAIFDRAVRSATPVQFLSGNALQDIPSQNISDALRYFSGVQIKDYGGIGGLKTINVRSLGAQHTGVFLDGVRITNAQNGQVDLGKFSLEDMEELRLYNCQKGGTLLNASDFASASSVYLRTRKPSFKGRSTNISARVKYGSFGTFTPSIRLEQRLGKSAISAGLAYVTSRGDYRFTMDNGDRDTTARRTNGDVSALRAQLGLFAHPGGGDLRITAYHYNSERGLPGPVVRRLSDTYSSADRQWDCNTFVQASYTLNHGKWAFRADSKASYDYLEYLSPSAVTAEIHNHYRQKELYASATVAYYPLPWLSANVATDFRRSTLDCDVARFVPVTRGDLRAAAAINAHHNGLTAQLSALGTDIRDRRDGEIPEPLRRLTPAATVSWTTGRLTLRSFYKSIFRAPTFNDLYYVSVGSASLRPERTRQCDFGAEMSTAHSEFRADVWYNTIHDKIVAMPTGSQFRWSMVNFGLVRGGGLGTSYKGNFSIPEGRVTVMASYTFEIARDCTSSDDPYYGNQIPYTPWNTISLVGDASWRRWSACMSWLYTGVRYRASDNMEDSRMAPWLTADLSLMRSFTIKCTGLKAGADISNLLNRQYEVVSRYPMPGMSIMIKLIVTI